MTLREGGAQPMPLARGAPGQAQPQAQAQYHQLVAEVRRPEPHARIAHAVGDFVRRRRCSGERRTWSLQCALAVLAGAGCAGLPRRTVPTLRAVSWDAVARRDTCTCQHSRGTGRRVPRASGARAGLPGRQRRAADGRRRGHAGRGRAATCCRAFRHRARRSVAPQRCACRPVHTPSAPMPAHRICPRWARR